ncbi:Histone acetyltransferase HPA2 and acetyltransferase [Yersinia intermedia]|jgi:putative acetyltransferase|uniref:GNAT family N-acetyltransferase n=1 Tax=Yersinia intermedia TaxID=631 RepID=UPI0005DD5E36|nr:GNAT family N-acetyltransferase [Yersinia intermedia]CNB55709.1 Histone acetyltransferase HPA2 and acetyltransferase [Yersinia intermedia]CNG75306.1 Histone acetyltransferase HPA2 and acetyltransferase [Yersinia intermedia]CNH97600.1 Histone acetyltransferase HPA2 and acetyltransferase [Yersinia intermedia]CQJ66602.1 Histone acetyltransferase HPA2 and acetyltransferase [Yersinia intermedia]
MQSQLSVWLRKKSDSRGLGIASMLATALIDKLIYLNLKNIYLEKEVHQPEAVKIYQRLGFELTSAFGCYQYDPLSLYRVKNWLVVLGER